MQETLYSEVTEDSFLRATLKNLRSLAFLRRLKPEARWGLAILVLMLLLSIFVPLLSPYDPLSGQGGRALSAPSLEHPFGTDQLRRDVFTRTFAAAQLDIVLALIGVTIPMLIGTAIGAILGTTRNSFISGAGMILIDAINAFPFIVLVLAVVAILGTGVQGLLIGLAATNWARYAKIARARALTIREADFIHATQVLGYSRSRVLLRHILPNVYTETLAYALSDFVIVVITISGLSFLGAGVRPPTAEWGAMMSEGRLFLRQQWWITVFPGLALSLTAIGMSLLALGLEDE